MSYRLSMKSDGALLFVEIEDTVSHAVLRRAGLMIDNQHVSILVRLNYDGLKDRMCACERREQG